MTTLSTVIPEQVHGASTSSRRRLRVLHIITQLTVGGATENTLTTCRLSNPDLVETAVLSGGSSPDDDTAEGIADCTGVKVHTFPSLQRSIRPLADYRCYQDMVRWLRENRWDIVHTHMSKGGIIGRLAAAEAGVPVIIHTAHGWGHNDRQPYPVRRIYIEMERRAAKVCDKMIVVADLNRERALRDGIGWPEQYTTIRSGIDVARFRDASIDRASMRASLGIPVDAPVVGTVSRLAPQKAPGDFVKMAAAISAKRPDTHFIFVGGGPLEAEFDADVKAAGLSEKVHSLGFRNDVPQVMKLFDIFVLTSLWEGLPRVFAQAMCAGLPVVATNVDGAPEAVKEGVNGFLLPPGEPVALAERVLTLIDNPSKAKAMARAGLDIADPEFSDREMVRKIEEAYVECARKKLPNFAG